MKEEIVNFNSKEQYHGYQQWYWDNTLVVRLNYKNGNEIGYEELHVLKKTIFYIR